ncbi:undecaprenyl-phosphate glucose phosphotransferase [Pseudoxanthomonas putridarboris]|uniref:Undecaprenyl-phosphate glucose phosphotransferase n=1 Tax=Pseudoxanthomonas putridarboris TaxID=752605 RepID=A0ABU9IYY5_9GAMM
MLLANLSADTSAPSPRLLSKYSTAADACLRISDLAMVLVAALLAYRLRFDTWTPAIGDWIPISTSILSAALCFNAFPLYRSWRGRGVLSEVWILGLAWTTVLALISVHTWLLQLDRPTYLLWVGLWYVLGFALLGFSRVAVRGVLSMLRSAGIDVRRVVVVGMRPPVIRIHRYLRQNAWVGMQIVGYFSTRDDINIADSTDLHCLGPVQNLREYLAGDRVEEVWISLPMGKLGRIKSVLTMLDKTPVKVKLVPDTSELAALNQSGEQIGSVPVINLRQGSDAPDNSFFIIKAAMDRTLALVALVGLAPLMLAIALAVKLSSPGPVLFRQKRHGRAGEEFSMLKFRSMRADLPASAEVRQATRGDPRVTRLGAFLRRSSLDELPQLFNVLGGSMSLVGPRPHAIQHNRQYGMLINCYMQRHYVKPGITGWAQVNGFRGETPRLRDMKKRVQYDMDYIRRWSPWLDLKIMALTAVRLFGQKQAY